MSTRAEVMAELDKLQEMIAGYVAEHGVRRVITQEVLQERVGHYLDVGKKELEAFGPEESSDRSDFKAMATVFGPSGQEGNICVAWPEGHKKHMMHALADTCRTLLAQAVIVRSVFTGSNMEKIAKAMELNMPDPRDYQKMKYFEERMWKWIEKNYGRARLAALPPEFRFDGLMVAGFGPKLHECGRSSLYEWKNGKLEFTDMPNESEVRISLIPRWWQ